MNYMPNAVTQLFSKMEATYLHLKSLTQKSTHLGNLIKLLVKSDIGGGKEKTDRGKWQQWH